MAQGEPMFQRMTPSLPLHRAVQDEIRSYIVTSGLQPGDPLKSEAELARQFGVSRNSVREAVKALESTGVVETRRGSGVFVREFSFAPLLDHLPYGLMQGVRTLSELLELRKVLETGMITDAMAALTPASRAALRDLLDRWAVRAARGEESAEFDRRFHRLLFADLGNELLLQVFDLFWLAYHRAEPHGTAREPVEVHRRHAAILDAVETGNSTRAREAVRDHYVGIERRIGVRD